MVKSVLSSSRIFRDSTYHGVLTLGLTYFVVAWAALALTRENGGIATIWPANGLIIASLLLVSNRRQLPFFLSAGLASIAANLLHGAAIYDSLAFTAANIVEAWAVVWLTRRWASGGNAFQSIGRVGKFLAATLAGSGVGALLATVLTFGTGLSFFLSWLTTVFIGTLVVVPLVLMFAKNLREPRDHGSRGDWPKLIIVSLAATVISAVVFASQEPRFLFLPVLCVVAATYLQGPRGAALTIGAICLTAVFFADIAPDASRILGISADILFLQFYLVSLLGAAWPLAALINQKTALIQNYETTNQFLKLAESTAKVGHWYLSADQKDLLWSSEVYRIYGFPEDIGFADDPPSLSDPDSLRQYHPEDRERVRETLIEAMEEARDFHYEARILCVDGSIRHVDCIGRADFDQDGQFCGLFGTFQEVTDRVNTMAALRNAQERAQSEAEKARILSETDDLTGLGNRRKWFDELAKAESSRNPVAIAAIDLDHFKAVNDNYGHQVGDLVLRKTAAIFSETVGENAIVGRTGGEEFVVLWQSETASGIAATAEKLRRRVENVDWEKIGPSQVTISIGLAGSTPPHDLVKTLRLADAALYRAKKLGRNRVEGSPVS